MVRILHNRKIGAKVNQFLSSAEKPSFHQ